MTRPDRVISRRRLCWQVGLSAATALLAIFTLISREWIELLTGWDPDRGSGSLEWSVVAVLGVVAILAGAAARAEWRRIRSRELRTGTSSGA